ncbi:Visual pigment-like receptor peropsin [Labeo rohita]|uniref:Visual pigment-like receptor peropsin n=1 Tax=Labeo rohita TaxID=84645 RepID=A0ABQ8MZR8_LABRO|nr:Visual pigment-like receptor peropsin [Labeo rohita]
MVLGVLGNGLVLIVKVVCKDHFQCLYWLPLFSLTISDFFCSILIICGSLLAVLSEGQISPWCEVVSLLKFTFITSSIGSLAILCVQRFMGIPSKGKMLSVLMAVACVASWCTGTIFGAVPVAYKWIRYDPAEMLCAVFWESSYSDMLVYILCAFSISIFVPFLLILVLLGRFDLSPSPEWLRSLSSVMAYLDCVLNPFIYCTNKDFRKAVRILFWNKRRSTFPDPVLTSITRLE